jgi:hypothetical protein
VKTVADVRLKGERLEKVESFIYLRSTIIWDGRSTSDIKRRRAQAKAAFMVKRSLLCSKSIRLETVRENIFIWAVALYRSEA